MVRSACWTCCGEESPCDPPALRALWGVDWVLWRDVVGGMEDDVLGVSRGELLVVGFDVLEGL